VKITITSLPVKMPPCEERKRSSLFDYGDKSTVEIKVHSIYKQRYRVVILITKND